MSNFCPCVETQLIASLQHRRIYIRLCYTQDLLGFENLVGPVQTGAFAITRAIHGFIPHSTSHFLLSSPHFPLGTFH